MKCENNLSWHVPFMLVLLLPLPPSSARRASCLVRPRFSERMLSERRRAIKKQLWAVNAASLSAAGGQGRHTGEGACSKTHLQYRRCLGVRAAPKSSHQVINRLAEVLLAVQSPLLRRLIIPLTQWSLRRFPHLENALVLPPVWLFMAALPPSKQNVLAQGGKKKSHYRLWCNIYLFVFYFFRNSGVESVFLQQTTSQGNVQRPFSVWASDIFRAALKKKVSEIRNNQFLTIFMGRKLINFWA